MLYRIAAYHTVLLHIVTYFLLCFVIYHIVLHQIVFYYIILCRIIHISCFLVLYCICIALENTKVYDSSLDFTDALFNPTKGSDKPTKTPKEVMMVQELIKHLLGPWEVITLVRLFLFCFPHPCSHPPTTFLPMSCLLWSKPQQSKPQTVKPQLKVKKSNLR